MKLVRAKPVAQFDTAISDYKLKSAEKLFQDVINDLSKGRHILLYPSSGLKVGAQEKIGGRSMAHATMQAAPQGTQILLVRLSGMWGSLFSKAYYEEAPDFWRLLGKGMWIIVKNLLLFTPKRDVTIEFAVPDKDFPVDGSKMEFNRALENFFNHYPKDANEKDADKKGANEKDAEKTSKDEPLKQVPLYFWSKKLPPLYKRDLNEEGLVELPVPKYIRQDILYQLSELSGKSVKEIKDSHDLVYDLGLDSLNIATLYTHLDNNYELTSTLQPMDLVTVQDLLAAAIHMKESKQESIISDSKSSWRNPEEKRPSLQCGKGETVLETFLSSCDRMHIHAACADAVSGEMDYRTMKRAIVILSRKIQKMEGQYIGIMLPSSIAVHLVIQATTLAGKIPVPLNWTIGRFFINHAIKMLNIQTVISSARFLERLDNVDLGEALEKMVLMEEIKKGVSLKEKLVGAWHASKKTKKMLKAFPGGRLRESDIAVALFTSGTTALPKCVMLSHKNLLVNQKEAIMVLDLTPNDVEIMVLPPFHIFGFNVGILPILYGLRCVYSPDPLDAASIAKQILKWRVSLIFMTPTFYSHLFRVANLNQLRSLRIFVSGAEAAPPSLVDFIQKLGDVWFIEGYGLTETSPILSVHRVGEPLKGVGKPLPSVDLVVVDVDTHKKLGHHQIGEICVRGDTVFSGYYKQDNKDVFLEINGQEYYQTGDLGYLDEDEYLYISGRLKLSFKKGGEMISLAAIEAAVFKKAKECGWIAQDINHNPFACVPKETPQGSKKVVLFSEVKLSLDQVNSALVESGFSRLYKVNEIVVIHEIPTLKSGKTCYRTLFEQVGSKTKYQSTS